VAGPLPFVRGGQPQRRDVDVVLSAKEINYHRPDRHRLGAVLGHPQAGRSWEFVAERGCRYGLVITNDSEPRLLDEAIPFSHL